MYHQQIKQRIARLKKQIKGESEKSKKEDILNDFMDEMSTGTIGNGHGWRTVKYLDGGTNEGESSSRLSSLSLCLHEEFGVSGVEGCLSGDQNSDMYDDGSYDLCFGFNKKFVTPKDGYYESAMSLTYNDRQLIINVSSCKENEIEKANKLKEEYRANIVMGIGDGNALIKQPSEIPKRFGLVKDKARSIKISPVFENTLSKYNTDLLKVINAEKDRVNKLAVNLSEDIGNYNTKKDNNIYNNNLNFETILSQLNNKKLTNACNDLLNFLYDEEQKIIEALAKLKNDNCNPYWFKNDDEAKVDLEKKLEKIKQQRTILHDDLLEPLSKGNDNINNYHKKANSNIFSRNPKTTAVLLGLLGLVVGTAVTLTTFWTGAGAAIGTAINVQSALLISSAIGVTSGGATSLGTIGLFACSRNTQSKIANDIADAAHKYFDESQNHYAI